MNAPQDRHRSRATCSVIIPAHNAVTTLAACLAGLSASVPPPDEIVVVDDGSSDGTAALADASGVRVASTGGRLGPAAARNLGAAVTTGSVLLFIDADVVVLPDTVGRFLALFHQSPSVSAAFGSYDRAPAAPAVVSQFKNLSHHYVHQTAEERSRSFWAGCGAIRREVFAACGGFDAARYPRSSIEDIALGATLWRAGHEVRLLKDVQVKHLKRWTLMSLIASDIRDRAYPWSRLLIEGNAPADDLNLRASHRFAALAAWIAVVAVGISIATTFALPALAVAFAGVTAILVVNIGLFRFLRAAGGWKLLAAAVPLHVLYLLYSSATFGACLVAAAVMRLRREPDE